MEYGLRQLIHADLASIQTAASNLASAGAVLPAAADNQLGASFAHSMRDALHAVDGKERLAADKMSEVDSGRSDDLVGAMLASQEASLSFSMLMQVRNKVMGAVEDLIKLPL